MFINCNKLKEFIKTKPVKIIMGIDWGHTITGIAITDDKMDVVMPCSPIKMNEIKNKNNFWAKLIKDYSVTAIIVGIPKHIEGYINKTEDNIIEFSKKLDTELINYGFNGKNEIPITFIDESNTSKQAEYLQHDIDNNGGYQKRKKKRENLNSISACLIIERAKSLYLNKV